MSFRRAMTRRTDLYRIVKTAFRDGAPEALVRTMLERAAPDDLEAILRAAQAIRSIRSRARRKVRIWMWRWLGR